ncbi:D-dopachrome decarboxylase [Solea solea]|uniref:D-dopachrome decarboxylase n=1 Tax=Solea solea TaxID=90069 RepID=UPI00272C572A|nr:D-dopachrome decarboxylase [Solea solea]
MPLVQLQTNLPASVFSEDFLLKFSGCLAASLGKPADRMNLAVTPALPLLVAGSCSPCVMLTVSAIGATDTADKNKEHSANIFDFLTSQLSLSEDRIIVQFNELQPHQVGKKRTVMTFL